VDEVLDLSLRMFRYAVLPLGPLLEYIPLGWVRQLHRARRRMDELIARMIAERRRDAVDRGDLLSMLLRAQDDMGDTGGMTDRQLRDELVTLLMAGHETTANALTWSWYLLSQHPDARTALEQEIRRVCGDRLPTAADVPSLVYTRAVLAESMRLFPPAYLLGRRALADYDVPGTDYVLPKGTVVLLSQYLLHRDPRFWDAPEQFRPERWLVDEGERRRYAYFPFGGGPRICIGEHFAWMEGALVLATIARRWRLESVAGQKIAFHAVITLRPKHGMRMKVEAKQELTN
jgi:cytochrome P450